VFLTGVQFGQISRCRFQHPGNDIAVFKCHMMQTFPADAVTKRVMHSYVTAPRYDWPEADFPFGQTAVHHGAVTRYGSSRVPKFRPLVRGSGETARWQKVEIHELINQIVALC